MTTRPPGGHDAASASHTMATSMPNAGPSFLGVGPPKTATSWLHAQFAVSSSVFVPRNKELRFFTDPDAIDRSPRHRLLASTKAHSDERRSAMRYNRRSALRSLASAARHGFDEDARSLVRWHFGQRTLDRYRQIFATDAASQAVARGELSPTYALLPASQVTVIAQALPSTKAFFTLREPLERAWSETKMFLREQKRSLGSIDDDALTEIVERRCLINDPATCLATWQASFAPDRLAVFLYDDLIADPHQFLNDVLGFIGVNADSRGQNLGPRSNVDPHQAQLPRQIAERLRPLANQQSTALAALLDDRNATTVTGWQRRG